MRIYVPILEIHQEKAGIKWGLSKKKQFSTIYESYKPILGFPTIFKTKTVLWPSNVSFSHVLPVPPCSILPAPDTIPCPHSQLQMPHSHPMWGDTVPVFALTVLSHRPRGWDLEQGQENVGKCPWAKKRWFFHL